MDLFLGCPVDRSNREGEVIKILDGGFNDEPYIYSVGSSSDRLDIHRMNVKAFLLFISGKGERPTLKKSNHLILMHTKKNVNHLSFQCFCLLPWFISLDISPWRKMESSSLHVSGHLKMLEVHWSISC